MAKRVKYTLQASRSFEFSNTLKILTDNKYVAEWTIDKKRCSEYPINSQLFSLPVSKDSKFKLQACNFGDGGPNSYTVSLFEEVGEEDELCIRDRIKVTFQWITCDQYSTSFCQNDAVASVIFWKNHSACLNENTVTFRCIVEPTEGSFCAGSQESVSGGDLSDDLQTMLNNELHSDITLVSGEVELPAHRAILSARSPVFNAMFSHDTLEKSKSRVVIEDMPADTIKNFLRYVYTGRVQNQTVDDYASLLAAADKYDIPNLKNHCAGRLMRMLTPETALDILVIADMHQATGLKTIVLNVIRRNAAEITNSPEWLKFMRENSETALLIVKSLAANQRYEIM